jgi:uncharacterized protein with GYD domain
MLPQGLKRFFLDTSMGLDVELKLYVFSSHDFVAIIERSAYAGRFFCS